MGRKLIAALICGIITFSLVSCKDKTEKNEDVSPKARVEEKIMEGTWSKDYTKDEVTAFHKTIISNVEDLTKIYELKYEKKEIVKDDKGETVNSNELNVEIENPEPNRLESMYYGFKIYGSDLAQGQLMLKIGFKLDNNAIKEAGEFDFIQTSIASYSQAFTGIDDRDYTQLNEDIFKIVNGDNPDGTIENNLDGITESITIKEDYLLYKLETKKYNFKK